MSLSATVLPLTVFDPAALRAALAKGRPLPAYKAALE